MDGHLARKGSRWLSIDLVARDLSEETGENILEVRRDLDKWYANFVRQQPFSEVSNLAYDSEKLEVDLLAGYIRREILHIYCEERRLPEPYVWLADEGEPHQRTAPIRGAGRAEEPFADEAYAGPVHEVARAMRRSSVGGPVPTDGAEAPRRATASAKVSLPEGWRLLTDLRPRAAERPEIAVDQGRDAREREVAVGQPADSVLAAPERHEGRGRFNARGLAIKRAFLDASKRLDSETPPADVFFDDALPEDAWTPEGRASLSLQPFPPVAHAGRAPRTSRRTRVAGAVMAALLLLLGGLLLWPDASARKDQSAGAAARQDPARPHHGLDLERVQVRSARNASAISPVAEEAPAPDEAAADQQTMATPEALARVAGVEPTSSVEPRQASHRNPGTAERWFAFAVGTAEPAAPPASRIALRQAAAFDGRAVMGTEPVLRADPPTALVSGESPESGAAEADVQPPPVPPTRATREDGLNPIPEAPPAPKPYASLDEGLEASDTRPSPKIVSVDDLVLDPNRYHGRKVVVTGSLGHLLWRYRLMSDSQQNSLVVNIEALPRAARARLRGAIQAAGRLGTVRTRVTGTVERDTVLTYRLVASDLALLD